MTTTLNARIVLRPVDPATDSALLHRWVTEERARFWGMLDRSVAEVEEIYAYIDEQDHLAAHLVCWDDEPWALFQTYDPAVDEIGQFYDRLPGDIGVHLLIGPGKRPEGFTDALFAHLTTWVFSDPKVQRVVLEPDVRNEKSLNILGRLDMQVGPQVAMPEKKAQFVFLSRADWTAAG
ncbi:acetyltransferase [Nocardioides sp. JQ2195]|uniref:GNAT family N-acetyltransferase n=1 Tax=Nocardioides sp. JQ2195 TaxID=2592334 RepID=UPI00143E9EF6|nr:GNAT family N-acetyltransferase [Nocardioides sp. JQ2195]QIX28377.1 acetyltransferase [Nocardioides sp. JQ2195]